MPDKPPTVFIPNARSIDGDDIGAAMAKALNIAAEPAAIKVR